jgi:hypothetical protein
MTPAKVLDQAKIMWEGSVIEELEAQDDLDHSDAQSVFEVNVVLADGLYHDKAKPKDAAAAILRPEPLNIGGGTGDWIGINPDAGATGFAFRRQVAST